MFYSTQILAKKGPLGLVWIAAHLDGRLKRQQINSASIDESVDTLLHPEAPLALRLSGQLLLGVVRIYQRKVRRRVLPCYWAAGAAAMLRLAFRQQKQLCCVAAVAGRTASAAGGQCK